MLVCVVCWCLLFVNLLFGLGVVVLCCVFYMFIVLCRLVVICLSLSCAMLFLLCDATWLVFGVMLCLCCRGVVLLCCSCFLLCVSAVVVVFGLGGVCLCCVFAMCFCVRVVVICFGFV